MNMEKPISVKVHEVYRVAPLPSSPNTTTPLTFFDLIWLRFPPVHRLFYYQFSPTHTSFFDSILPKLKHSLSLTLHHFLPLAGNIIWPPNSHKPFINYVNGDSVSLVVAESDADFEHLSGKDLCEATECHSLVPQLTVSDDQAQLMSLQVTLFPNRGFCVGITTHHATLDGKSSTSFMKIWAQICRLGGDFSLSPELKPFLDRTVIKDHLGLDSIFAYEWLNQNGPNNRSLLFRHIEVPPDSVRGTFELTRAKIEILRKTITKDLEQLPQKREVQQQFHITTFSLTCAYVWVCLLKAEDLKESNTIFISNVDCRARLEYPIPSTYIGNCVVGRPAIAETSALLEENRIAMAVEAFSRAIRGLNDDGLLAGAEQWVSRLMSVGKKRTYAAAGSPRFEVYSADFGWGKPKKVEMTSIDRTGAISLSDSRNGDGGIEIGIVLNKHVMDAFAFLFAQGLESMI